MAKCLGEREDETLDPLTWLYTAKPTGCWDFCTNWALGGPLKEREGIASGPQPFGGFWAGKGHIGDETVLGQFGPTELVAIARCYVTSKLGETAEVPEELL